MPAVSTQSDAAALRAALHETMGRAVVGQIQVIDGLYIAVLCGGHVLLEGVPGTAKTLDGTDAGGGSRRALHPHPVHA